MSGDKIDFEDNVLNTFQSLFDNIKTEKSYPFEEYHDSLCESEIELIIADALKKFMSDDAKLIPQYKVHTSLACYRIDFIIQYNDLKIGIECDGKEFHRSYFKYPDEFRDAIILGESDIFEIIRFRGENIFYSPETCLHLVSLIYPQLFTRRALEVLPQYAHAVKIEIQKEKLLSPKDLHGQINFHYTYFDENSNRARGSNFDIVRHTKNTQKQFWQVMYRYYQQYPAIKNHDNFDEIWVKNPDCSYLNRRYSDFNEYDDFDEDCSDDYNNYE